MALSKRVRLSAENGQLQCYKKMHIHYNNLNVRVKRYGSLTLLVIECRIYLTEFDPLAGGTMISKALTLSYQYISTSLNIAEYCCRYIIICIGFS